MATILHVEASPRGAISISSTLAEEFVQAYLKTRPATLFAKLPLWDLALPAFDEVAMNAKFKTADGEALSDEEAATWAQVKTVFSLFNSAERYVFSVPMWNFGIPYKLKHFIDVITQPGLAFAYEPGVGFKGLLTGRKALVVAARGGSYAGMEGDPMDFQIKYMKLFLGFIGITDVEVLLAEGLNVGQRESALASARAQIPALAAKF